ncbi:MAG: YggT family protein [Chloroflexota bacterium]
MTAIGGILLNLIFIYEIILIARILSSWIPLDRSNQTIDSIMRFLYDATEPVLAPVRGALPPMGGFDFSPILVFIGLQVISALIRSAFIF